jgi:hypothetical protein
MSGASKRFFPFGNQNKKLELLLKIAVKRRVNNTNHLQFSLFKNFFDHLKNNIINLNKSTDFVRNIKVVQFWRRRETIPMMSMRIQNQSEPLIIDTITAINQIPAQN